MIDHRAHRLSLHLPSVQRYPPPTPRPRASCPSTPPSRRRPRRAAASQPSRAAAETHRRRPRTWCCGSGRSTLAARPRGRTAGSALRTSASPRRRPELAAIAGTPPSSRQQVSLHSPYHKYDRQGTSPTCDRQTDGRTDTMAQHTSH